MWLLWACFMAALIDRYNIGYAAIPMRADLGLTATQFGIAITVFFLGYFLFEIPSNLMMVRFGPRIWLARILITWGLASSATMFAVGPYSLWFYRGLVGIAEAGFQPAMLVFLTYFFPQFYRTKVMSYLMVAQPLAMIFGALLASPLLAMHAMWGLQGWQRLFLVEGIPAVVLGFIVLSLLPNKPADAPWLSDAEKIALTRRLESEDKAAARKGSLLVQLREFNVLMLTLVSFLLGAALNANASWAPQIVREFVKQSNLTDINLIAAVPSLVGAVMMIFWARSSARRQEWTWHLAIPLVVAAFGWSLVAWWPSPMVRFCGLVLGAGGTYVAMAIFWALATSNKVLSEKARAVGVPVINSAGILGAVASPFIVGVLRDMTGAFSASVSFVSFLLLLAAVVTTVVNRRIGNAAAGSEDQLSSRLSIAVE